MSDYVILFRNGKNGKVGFVSAEDDEDSLAVFVEYDEAVRAADKVPVCRIYPWQVVELDIV